MNSRNPNLIPVTKLDDFALWILDNLELLTDEQLDKIALRADAILLDRNYDFDGESQ